MSRILVHYKLTAGNWSVDSSTDPRTELIELETVHSLEAPIDRTRIRVYAPPPPAGGVLGQAVAAVQAGAAALGIGGAAPPAFAVKVRGQTISPGDGFRLELASGDISGVVMSGEVESYNSSLGYTEITARTGMHKLVTTRVNRVYLNQSASQVIQDLAGQAGVSTGTVAQGATQPYLVIDESAPLERHLRALARRENADLYFDTDNRLNLQAYSRSQPDHEFRFGMEILDLRLANHAAAGEQVRVDGESPASNRGLNSWPWLVKDASPFQGTSGQGNRLLRFSDGAIRTKDAADKLAGARLTALQDGATRGRVTILGNPGVQIGQAIAISGTDKDELNGMFKVTDVRHRFGKQDGYLTVVHFTGQAAAMSGGGLMGGLAAAAGALGL
jgi:hypothetical protein